MRPEQYPRGSALLRFSATVALCANMAGLTMLTSGCRCEARPEEGPKTEQHELPLLEPLSQATAQADTCVQVALPERVLRSGSLHDASASSIEVESGALAEWGFALFSYRSSKETQWLVATATEQSPLLEIPLGRAIGSVEPPLGVIHNGALLVLLQDNEAMGQRMQLIRIDSPTQEQKITRGPSISIGRDESPAASLVVSSGGTALLVWDEFDRASNRSRVMGLSFDPQSLKEKGPARLLSLKDEDAEQPKLVPQGEGFSLTYLKLTTDPSAASDDALVVEPKRSLQVRILDSQAQPSTEPARISEEYEHVLAFDAAENGSGQLIAYKSTRTGNTVEGSGISLAQIGPDGAIVKGQTEHDQLGPGAPVLLGHRSKHPWLLARGLDAELLKAEVSDVADVKLHAENGLAETIPLARFEQRLLVIKPVGLDWSISYFDCPERAP